MDDFSNSNNGNNGIFTAPPIIKPMGFFERIIAVFAAPVKLMKSLSVYPKFGHAILMFLVMGIITGVLTLRYSEITMLDQRAMFEERYGTEFTEFMMQSSDLSGTMSQLGIDPAVLNTITAASGAISFIGTYLFNSLIMSCIFMIFVKIFKGNVRFINLFAMVMSVSIIDSFGATLIIMTGVILGTSLNVFSLAFLAGGSSILSPVYCVLTSLNVFSIWGWILYGLGLMHICNLSKTKAITVMCIIVLGIVLFSGFITPMLSTITYDFTYNTMQSMPAQ